MFSEYSSTAELGFSELLLVTWKNMSEGVYSSMCVLERCTTTSRFYWLFDVLLLNYPA